MTREDVVNRLKEIETDFETYMAGLDGEALTNAGSFIASLRAKLTDIPEGIPEGEVVAKDQYDKVKDAYKAIIMGREPSDDVEDVIKEDKVLDETTTADNTETDTDTDIDEDEVDIYETL